MTAPDLQLLEPPGGAAIAYRRREGGSPTLLFLPGYASDMDGAKALALDGFAAERGLGMVRFDYSGTGASPGRFEDGALDRWLADSLAIVDHLTNGPLLLVGSSMGGWLALHLAILRPERMHALLGIAAAPDFTDWGFSTEQRDQLRTAGRLERHGQLTTRAFWESGQALRLLDRSIAISCPVRLIHGAADSDVPLDIALRTLAALRSADVQLKILKDGGHRLSEPHEIRAILATVAELLEPA